MKNLKRLEMLKIMIYLKNKFHDENKVQDIMFNFYLTNRYLIPVVPH